MEPETDYIDRWVMVLEPVLSKSMQQCIAQQEPDPFAFLEAKLAEARLKAAKKESATGVAMAAADQGLAAAKLQAVRRGQAARQEVATMKVAQRVAASAAATVAAEVATSATVRELEAKVAALEAEAATAAAAAAAARELLVSRQAAAWALVEWEGRDVGCRVKLVVAKDEKSTLREAAVQRGRVEVAVLRRAAIEEVALRRRVEALEQRLTTYEGGTTVEQLDAMGARTRELTQTISGLDAQQEQTSEANAAQLLQSLWAFLASSAEAVHETRRVVERLGGQEAKWRLVSEAATEASSLASAEAIATRLQDTVTSLETQLAGKTKAKATPSSVDKVPSDLDVVLHKETATSKLGLTLSVFSNDIGHPRVQFMQQGSVADASGQLQIMDIIMAINGVKITSDKQARELISNSRGELRFAVRRHGSLPVRSKRSSAKPSSGARLSRY